MDDLLSLNVLSRWIHMGTAIVLLGGSVFLRYVLHPSASQLSDDEHQRLRELVMGRWRKFVAAGIGLLLLSGLYNYVVAIPSHKGDGLYHGLMGTKILLALVVFFLASALSGRSQRLESLRQNSSRWLGLTILLAAIVVAIAGFLKVAARPSPADAQDRVESKSTAQHVAV